MERIEAPKGELGFYLVSDGSPNPYRYRVRPPSLINLTVLEDFAWGGNVADIVAILGSIDIVLGRGRSMRAAMHKTMKHTAVNFALRRRFSHALVLLKGTSSEPALSEVRTGAATHAPRPRGFSP